MGGGRHICLPLFGTRRTYVVNRGSGPVGVPRRRHFDRKEALGSGRRSPVAVERRVSEEETEESERDPLSYPDGLLVLEA